MTRHAKKQKSYQCTGKIKPVNINQPRRDLADKIHNSYCKLAQLSEKYIQRIKEKYIKRI